jgi:hypothetical protein
MAKTKQHTKLEWMINNRQEWEGKDLTSKDELNLIVRKMRLAGLYSVNSFDGDIRACIRKLSHQIKTSKNTSAYLTKRVQ